MMLSMLLALQAALVEPTPSDPFAFFRPSVVVSADDRRRLDRGEPLARALPGGSREVAVFAAVPVEIDGDRLVAWMRQIAVLKKSPYVLAIGRFSDPPRLEDLADLVLDDEDLSEIRQCRPGACGLKLARSEIDQLRSTAVEAGSAWKPALQEAFRRIVLRRVQAYLEGGHATLGHYENRDRPISLAGRFSLLLQHSAFLSVHLPQFTEYLDRYPRARLEGVESMVYWSKERLGAKAIVSATHVSIVRGTGDLLPDALVAGKGIFATHYLDGSLGITAIMRGEQGARHYLVYLNRSEVDAVGGFLGGIVRWFVERRVKAEAADVLLGLRRRLESGEPPRLPVEG